MVHIVGRAHASIGKLSKMGPEAHDCVTIAEQLQHEALGVAK